MADTFFKIKRGAKLIPETGSIVTQKGDLATNDTSSKLEFHNGTIADPVVTEATAATLTNKSIDADTNTITNIENADIKTGAAIDRAKLASGTADHVLINDGSGVLSSEAALDETRGGLGVSNPAGSTLSLPDADAIVLNTTAPSTLTLPTTGTLSTLAGTETLTNKTLTTPVIDQIVTSTNTDLNLNPNGTGKVVTDNLALSGNKIESTNSNGDINLDPNGTGAVQTEARVNLPEIASPATPPSGYGSVYFKSDGKFYWKNDAGTEAEAATSLTDSGNVPSKISNYSLVTTPQAIAATLVLQDLTYTADAGGILGNNITIEYTAGGTAGAEIVSVVGDAISVQIEDSVSTATQVKAAIDGDAPASALVSVAISGTAGNAQVAVAATNLAGGGHNSVVALKGKDGSDPSGINVVSIAFRNLTDPAGSYEFVDVTAPLSVTIPYGATLGGENIVHVYILNNSGTPEMCVSATPKNTETLQSTIALDNTSDSNGPLYSITARTLKPLRYLGKLRYSLSIIDNWDEAADYIALDNKDNSVPNNHIHLVTIPSPARGSTDTAVYRFTTVKSQKGEGMTYADSAANGTTVTIQEDGIYSVHFSTYQANSFSAAFMSVTKNVSGGGLTALFDGSNDQKHLGIMGDNGTPATTSTNSISWSGPLKAGDILYVLGTTDSRAGDAYTDNFVVTQVGRL